MVFGGVTGDNLIDRTKQADEERVGAQNAAILLSSQHLQCFRERRTCIFSISIGGILLAQLSTGNLWITRSPPVCVSQ